MFLARTKTLTSLAMIALACSSLPFRLAPREISVDAASFTTIRLLYGAFTLWLVVRIGVGSWAVGETSHRRSPCFACATGFSYASTRLPAAMGALLLFGAVQATMTGYGIWA
jgi:hypothetical protein